MKYVVMSVYDRASMAYGRPAFVAALGAGMRSFADEVNRAEAGNEMNKHPGDFDLFHLGEFDDSTGVFTMLEVPKNVCTGASVVIPKTTL